MGTDEEKNFKGDEITSKPIKSCTVGNGSVVVMREEKDEMTCGWYITKEVNYFYDNRQSKDRSSNTFAENAE
jgi:hypothetical protein